MATTPARLMVQMATVGKVPDLAAFANWAAAAHTALQDRRTHELAF